MQFARKIGSTSVSKSTGLSREGTSMAMGAAESVWVAKKSDRSNAKMCW
jgi:hypothetical protein